MLHRHINECIDRTLKDSFQNNVLFGGKICIFSGDFNPDMPKG